jgi:hypothetical protein
MCFPPWLDVHWEIVGRFITIFSLVYKALDRLWSCRSLLHLCLERINGTEAWSYQADVVVRGTGRQLEHI